MIAQPKVGVASTTFKQVRPRTTRKGLDVYGRLSSVTRGSSGCHNIYFGQHVHRYRRGAKLCRQIWWLTPVGQRFVNVAATHHSVSAPLHGRQTRWMRRMPTCFQGNAHAGVSPYTLPVLVGSTNVETSGKRLFPNCRVKSARPPVRHVAIYSSTILMYNAHRRPQQ